MKNSSHFDNAKAVIALLIVLVVLGVFMLFYTNSEVILQDGGFYSFITFAVIGFSLLLGLMYLVNNSKHPSVRVNKATVKKRKKSRR